MLYYNYNTRIFLSCTRTNSELPKILVDLVDLVKILVLFKRSNHDPRTENNYFMNNEQATSDRVQAKNPQAKRGSLINFFYN